MKKNMIRFIAFAGLLTFVLSGCGGAKSSTTETGVSGKQKPDKVCIGVQTLVTPELAARYEKLYESYLGTDVEMVQFDSGADVNRAFAGKSIDIGALGTSPAAIGISGDLGYEVIWYHDLIGSAETLVAHPDSGISSVFDLVGKKVATPFASTAHYSLLNAISISGINASDVELLDMQPDDIYAAWSRGDIDAAYVWDPVLSKLYDAGGTAIIGGKELSEQGVMTADLCVVNKEFADKYPETVTAYIRAQIYITDKFYSEKDVVIEEMAEIAGIDKTDAKKQAEGFIYLTGKQQIADEYLGSSSAPGALAETLKNTADFLVDQGSIDKAPEIDVFKASITGKFVEEALK